MKHFTYPGGAFGIPGNELYIVKTELKGRTVPGVVFVSCKNIKLRIYASEDNGGESSSTVMDERIRTIHKIITEALMGAKGGTHILPYVKAVHIDPLHEV